jgi:cytochrome c556
MRSPIIRSIVLTTGLILASAMASAHTVPAKDAIKFRQSAFFLIGNMFGQVNGMAQGKVPMNEAVLKSSAANLNMLIQLPFHAFPEGSDEGKTKAKPEIWMESKKFNDAKEASQAAVGKLNAAVALAAGVGKTCKGCHDQFKQ